MRFALTRQQLAALGALCGVVLLCLFSMAYSLSTRADAAEELAERRATVARLARGTAPGGQAGPAKVMAAPPAALIEAPTQGQAGAQLQSYFSRLALEQNATVASSGVEAPTAEAPEAIRVQATLEIPLSALQQLLYKLETGTPYLTVDTLSIQPPPAASQQGLQEGPLRVTLMLRGQWRRGAA
jgi:general secretion pathway protein M